MKVAATYEKAESVNLFLFAVPFHVGAYFCMGAYKRDVVVVIKMGAYIHGMLIFYECLLSQFYAMCSIALIKLKFHSFTYKWLLSSYFSVFKLLFTLRTSASAEAPSDPTLFDLRLWKRALQN